MSGMGGSILTARQPQQVLVLRRAQRRRTAGRTLAYVLLAGWALFAIFPLYWTVITSLKTPLAVNTGPNYFPWVDFVPTLSAWERVFTTEFGGGQVWHAFTNSVVVGTVSSLFSLVIGALAAYGLSRFQYRVGRFRNDDIAFWILSQRILPPIAVVIPLFIIFRSLRLLDSRTALILAYGVFNLPFAVWLMRDFFLSIPREVEECALVDGASPLGTFFRIALPLSAPGLAATFVFCLIFSWNEFLMALVLTYSKAQTMPLLIAGQNFQRGPQWWDISALALLTVAPVVIFSILIQRYLVRGLTLGALKE